MGSAGVLTVLDDVASLERSPADVAGSAARRAPATLTVGAGGYPTVAAAIEAAGPHDIVSVGPGVYTEPLTIDKPLTLRGAGPLTVYTSMLTVAADDVIVDGDTFSGIVGGNWDTAGVITRKQNSSPVYRLNVNNCTFVGCRQGVFLFGSVGCMVEDCTFVNCTRGVTIRGHNVGMGTYESRGNTIRNCEFRDQRPNGLWDGEAVAINGSGAAYTSGNLVSRCLMVGNGYGVHIGSSVGNEVSSCEITGTRYAPLSFIGIDGSLSVHDNVLSSNDGPVRFTSCTGFAFTSNEVTDSEGRIVVESSSLFTFSGNTVAGVNGSVLLARCSSFTFDGNSINGSSVALEGSTAGSLARNAFATSPAPSIEVLATMPTHWLHTISSNNTVGGWPIYYFYGASGPVVADTTAGSITFAYCTAPTVRNATVRDGDGVLCYASDDATLGADVSNCLRGLTLVGSNGFVLGNCTVDPGERGGTAVNATGSSGDVFDSALASGAGALDWDVADGSVVSSYNTTFDLDKVDVMGPVGGELWVHNYLRVEVRDNGSIDPLPGVDVLVSEGAATLYATAHYGGADARTGPDGMAGPIALLDRAYVGNNTPAAHAYDLEVWTSIDAVWTEARKALAMVAGRVEAFEAADIRAPATPRSVLAVDLPYQDAINVSWEANADDTVTYSVYINSTGEWALLRNVSAPATSVLVDSGLVNGTVYWFRVSAWDEVPLQSVLAAPAEVLHLDWLAPAAPAGLRALSVNGTDCTLGWDANVEPDVMGYRLYVNRSGAGADGPWREVIPGGGTRATALWVQGLASETDYYFVVTAFDETPNESPRSTALRVRTLDITPPLAPVLDAPPAYTNRSTIAVTGTAEVGSTVTVLVNGAEAGTGVAGADGRFNITVALSDGANAIAARATDGSGNTGPLSPEVGTILDTRAPDAPALDALPALTNVPTHTVAGIAEGLSTVTVLANGAVVGRVVTGPDGLFTLDVTLAEGENLVTAFATDRALNHGPRAAALRVVLDTIAPAAPALDAPPAYVNDPELELRGTAEPLSRVEVLAGGAVLATTSADASGAFVATVTLAVRRTELQARATDAATNVGPLSAAASVILDTEPPVARAGTEITQVEEREVEFDGSASTDNEGIANWTWTFTLGGTQVTLPGERAGYTFPDPVTLTATLAVRDLAGNTATDTVEVVIVRKNLPPTLSDGAVTPEKGTTRTDFTFTVTLTDADGDNGTVSVVIDGVSHAMVPEPSDTDTRDGQRFTYTTELGLGPHTYYFTGRDDKGNDAGGASAGPAAQRTTSEVKKPRTASSAGIGILAIVIVLVAVAAIVALALSRRKG